MSSRRSLIRSRARPLAAQRAADEQNRFQDLVERALVGAEHGHAGPDQIADDIALKIGEGQDQIRLQREDPLQLERREAADASLLARGFRAPRGAGDADDPITGAQQERRSPRSRPSGRRHGAGTPPHSRRTCSGRRARASGRSTPANPLSSSHPGNARAHSRGPCTTTARERTAALKLRSPSQTSRHRLEVRADDQVGFEARISHTQVDLGALAGRATGSSAPIPRRDASKVEARDDALGREDGRPRSAGGCPT